MGYCKWKDATQNTLDMTQAYLKPNTTHFSTWKSTFGCTTNSLINYRPHTISNRLHCDLNFLLTDL